MSVLDRKRTVYIGWRTEPNVSYTSPRTRPSSIHRRLSESNTSYTDSDSCALLSCSTSTTLSTIECTCPRRSNLCKSCVSTCEIEGTGISSSSISCLVFGGAESSTPGSSASSNACFPSTGPTSSSVESESLASSSESSSDDESCAWVSG